MNVLYIAGSTPYDSVSHAGGQTLNYYIRNMAKQKDVNVTLVSYCTPEEEEVARRELPKEIDSHLIVRHKTVLDFVGNIFSINSKFNPWHRYGNMMTTNAAHILKKELRKIKNTGYSPDIVIMEWTQITVQVEDIKKIFPYSKYIASEHDVSYLGARRRAQNINNKAKAGYEKIKAENLYKRELQALAKCDLVMPHNNKDADLVIKDGIESQKVMSLVPYYHRSVQEYCRTNNDIIFFGYMRRDENKMAAKWFAENVMPRLKDLDVRFVIIGGGVSKDIKDLESDKIKVLGYVPEVDPYFSGGMCFVAPLILGAGIKVKILEAMYSGIPVLTNDIGIEGIEAEDKKDYYHCVTAEEYEKVIRTIYSTESSVNGKEKIVKEFNLDTFFDQYYQTIKEIWRGKRA